MKPRCLRSAAAIAALVALVACEQGAPSLHNLLADPGFEEGGAAWLEQSAGVEIVGAPVRSGRKAARLRLESEGGARERPVAVAALVQELRPTRFPDLVEGWYRVERLEKESRETALYLQVVVVVWGDPRTGRLVDPDAPDPGLRNYQLRYALAGIDRPPYEPPDDIDNARYVFVSTESPPPGEWVPFRLPVRADMERLWGAAPEDFEFVRVLFEVRWDQKPRGTAARADVLYDDLFVGEAGEG